MSIFTILIVKEDSFLIMSFNLPNMSPHLFITKAFLRIKSTSAHQIITTILPNMAKPPLYNTITSYLLNILMKIPQHILTLFLHPISFYLIKARPFNI